MEDKKKDIVEEVRVIEGDLKIISEKIIKILKKYVDLREDYYPIISYWIIGTYMHDSFLTYPYLFFNAMRGSGKTRLLKLISTLSKNGKLLVNISESVLFRTAKGRTICIDELEHITGKDRLILRELLNAGYKKGLYVERATKIKSNEGEKYVIESFDVYCPICMANIWGLDDVLADRCIILILEKSSRKEITKLMENFDFDPDIQELKDMLKRTFNHFSDGSVVSDVKKIYIWYNTVIYNNISDIQSLHTYTSEQTLPSFNIDFNNLINFIIKIKESELSGRDIELFFPLLFISLIAQGFDEFLKIAEKITNEKKQEEIVENRDVILLELIVNDIEETDDFISVRYLTEQLKEKCEGADWITPEWVGRALKRLNLVIEKKRVSHGREVRINFAKAREKLRIFEPVGHEPEKKQEESKTEAQELKENTNQEVKQSGCFSYYKVIKPIDIITLYNNEPKPLKAQPLQEVFFTEFGDDCFRVIKILQDEGYISPLIKNENE